MHGVRVLFCVALCCVVCWSKCCSVQGNALQENRHLKNHVAPDMQKTKKSSFCQGKPSEPITGGPGFRQQRSVTAMSRMGLFGSGLSSMEGPGTDLGKYHPRCPELRCPLCNDCNGFRAAIGWCHKLRNAARSSCRSWTTLSWFC